MKKLKKVVIALTTLALAAAMGFGSLTTVFAANLFGGTDTTNTINFKTTAEFGEEITLPAPAGVALTVKAPNGKELNDIVTVGSEAKFVAKMVGYYEVAYENSNGSKYNQFKILVSLNDEWVIRLVDNKGVDVSATIPTYAKKSTTDKITLPAAEAVVYDEDGEVEKTETTVDVSVTAPDGTAATLSTNNDGLKQFAPEQQGKYFVRYSYRYSSNSSYALTKDFTIQVQTSFEDKEIPKLSINNPNASSNINVAYTLPKASATDNFDTNVQISVKVVDPDGEDVKVATVDEETDYATGVTTDNVVFDNNSNLKFYPTKTGIYRVTYVGTDDSGNASVSHSYSIDIVDKLSPVITVDESTIPYTWGTTVKYGDATNPSTLTGAALDVVFPYPSVIDNSGTVSSIGFKLKKGDVTILSFTNIKEQNGTSNVSGAYTFDDEDGLSFNFGTYETTNERYGEYTATYTADDNSPSSVEASKSYTITYTNTVSDFKKPVVSVADFPSYITIDETDFTTYTIPTVSLLEEVSKTRTKLDLVLKVYTGATSVDYKVEQGDKLEFNSSLELYNIATKAVEAVTLSGVTSIELAITAKDHATNVGTASYTAQIINKADYAAAKYAISALSVITVNPTQKAEVILGDFNITQASGNAVNFDYVGFQVVVTDPSGNVIGNSSADVIFKNTKLFNENKIVVKNFTFTPAKSGDYLITVKAFDLAGNAAIVSEKVTVAPKGGTSFETDNTSAEINWPTTLQQGKVFTMDKLTAYTLDNNGDRVYQEVVIHVEGGLYEMSARQFTSYQAGDYRISYSANGLPHNSFTVKVDDTTAPEIKVLGSIPAYSAINATPVVLPEAVAIALTGYKMHDDYTGTTQRAYTVEVLDKNNEVVEQTTDSNGNLTFIPTIDGKYTITYTVYGNGQSSNSNPTFVFTMYAGDIVAPDFTVTAPSAVKSTWKIGDYFTFSSVTVPNTEYTGSENTEILYTKTIISPDGTSYVVSGKGESYRTKTANSSNVKGFEMTQAGTYKVTYEVQDKAGNVSVQKYTITVAPSNNASKISTAVVSTVLVILGVLLLVGVGVYLWRGRPVKED